MTGAIGEIVTSEEEWDTRLFDMADSIALCSKDPVRKVGGLLVSPDRRQFSPGYNGFPHGTPDLKHVLNDEQSRLDLMVHAEINAILQAPFDTKGCTLYVTKFPCARCAGIIANARIVRVVAPAANSHGSKWADNSKLAGTILVNAGVEVTRL